MEKIQNNYYLYSGLFLFALVFSFFGFGKIQNVLAGQCMVQIESDVKPNPASFNQPISLSGNIWFKTGTVFNGPAEPNPGLCNSDSGDPVKAFYVEFWPNNLFQPATLTAPKKINEKVPFNISVIPSEKGYSEGDTINVTVGVWPNNNINSGSRLVQSGTTNVKLSKGVYATYACVGKDSLGREVYICSPSKDSSCSDVKGCTSACQEIKDSAMCGNTASTYACLNSGGTYSCSSSGLKSDCSDTSGCSTEEKAKCAKIDFALCGQKPGTAQAQASQATNSNNTSNASQSTAAATGDRTANCTGPNPDPNLCLINPLPTAALTDMLLRILRGFFMVVGIWAVAFVMIGGFRMIMAAGNEEQYTQAKKTIIWAIMGFVIAVMSFAIIAVVQNFIGAKNISESDVIKTK